MLSTPEEKGLGCPSLPREKGFGMLAPRKHREGRQQDPCSHTVSPCGNSKCVSAELLAAFVSGKHLCSSD